MLVGLMLFLAFRYGLRGGNNLVSTFLVAGLTMVSAAGTADFPLAVTVVGALVKGLVLAVLVAALTHVLFPEPVSKGRQPAAQVMPDGQAVRIALRAALVVMPAYLLAITDPASYMPIIMKSVSLGRQSCTTTARSAARDLIGSTLLGGLLAIVFWFALRLFVDLWMFYLWMLPNGRNVLHGGPRGDGEANTFDDAGNLVLLRDHGADHRVRRRGPYLNVWSDRCDIAGPDRHGVHGADRCCSRAGRAGSCAPGGGRCRTSQQAITTVLSEPLVDLSDAWEEIAESTAIVARRGNIRRQAFVPRMRA